MSAYRDGELRALAAYALEVFSDPGASALDRSAARERLLADTRTPDMSLLGERQLIAFVNAARTMRALLAVARGDAYKAPDIVPEPFTIPERGALLREPVAPTLAPEPVTPKAEPSAPADPLDSIIPSPSFALAKAYTLAELGLV